VIFTLNTRIDHQRHDLCRVAIVSHVVIAGCR
jgi:hypothetical protein